MSKTVEIPVEVLANAESLDDIENWLIAHDPESLAALSEARRQHLKGETYTMEEVRAELEKRRHAG